jgi:hypothetical protein
MVTVGEDDRAGRLFIYFVNTFQNVFATTLTSGDGVETLFLREKL